MKIYRLAAKSVIACTSGLSLAACSIGLITVSPAADASAASAAVVGHALPAGASPTAPRHLYFQMTTTSGATKTIPVIAWGLFTAAGTDHENQGGANGTVHTFAFPGGTFQLKYRLPSAIAESGNPSCLSTGSGSGTYTLSGGTGKYKGISGSGHYTLNFIEIQAKANGSCSLNRPPEAFQQVITASGPAKLP